MTIELHRWISIRWKHELKGRYYVCLLEQDVWGEWVLTLAWGGQKKTKGTSRKIVARDYQDALLRIENIKKIRKKHDYEIVWQTPCHSALVPASHTNERSSGHSTLTAYSHNYQRLVGHG